MKIDDVKAVYLEVPLPKTIKIGALAPIETVPLTMVKISTDEGIKGTGASGYGYGHRKTLAAFINNELKPMLVGEDPFTIERLFEKICKKYMAYVPLSGIVQRVSCIEIALWDVVGKASSQPVYKLLGGYNEKIKAYCSTYLWRTPEEHAGEAIEYVNQGFKAIKLRGGRPNPRIDLEMVKAVRDAVGDDVDIIVDAIWAYSRQVALKMARKFEKHDIAFLEEPLPPYDLDGLADLVKNVDIPIAGGENYYDIYAFKQVLVKGALDVLQPDVTRAGGILHTRKIAALAEAWNKPIVPHSGTLLTETLQLLGSIPNSLYVEFSQAVRPIRDELLKEPIIVKDGYIEVPKGPGLGIELNEEAVIKYIK